MRMTIHNNPTLWNYPYLSILLPLSNLPGAVSDDENSSGPLRSFVICFPSVSFLPSIRQNTFLPRPPSWWLTSPTPSAVASLPNPLLTCSSSDSPMTGLPFSESVIAR